MHKDKLANPTVAIPNHKLPNTSTRERETSSHFWTNPITKKELPKKPIKKIEETNQKETMLTKFGEKKESQTQILLNRLNRTDKEPKKGGKGLTIRGRKRGCRTGRRGQEPRQGRRAPGSQSRRRWSRGRQASWIRPLTPRRRRRRRRKRMRRARLAPPPLRALHRPRRRLWGQRGRRGADGRSL